MLLSSECSLITCPAALHSPQLLNSNAKAVLVAVIVSSEIPQFFQPEFLLFFFWATVTLPV